MARRTINSDRYGIAPNPHSEGAHVELKLVRYRSAWQLNGEHHVRRRGDREHRRFGPPLAARYRASRRLHIGRSPDVPGLEPE
jgi:hypothetical protein